MRFYVVLRYITQSLLVSSAFMLISAGVGYYYGDESVSPLLFSSIIVFLIAVFPLIFIPATKEISNKEGTLIVVLSWALACLIGTFPYILYGGPFTFANAVFESVSGFTTTGSTILANIEAVPKGLLFWRASTHWIGGVGIIIFVLAVLPFMGIAEMVLFRSEVSSMARENFHLRAAKTIRIIAAVYLVLTLLEVLALMLAGMNLFDAVTHSFATIATGGFSPKNASIAYYNSVPIEIIVIVFMILSGMHFGLLFSVTVGNVKSLWNSDVTRYYLLAILGATLISSFNTWGVNYDSFWDALRYTSFNIISVGTSTGFANADTAVWPSFSQLLLMFFALQCACAGSTSGGIKTDRMLIFFKAFFKKLKTLKHPNAIFTVRLDKNPISDDLVYKSVLYVAVYIVIVFISTMLLTLAGVDILEAFSGAIAAMGNVGPGLGKVGSTGNFNFVSDTAKWIYSITMLMGRLEIYAIFIVFTPSQWKSSVSY